MNVVMKVHLTQAFDCTIANSELDVFVQSNAPNYLYHQLKELLHLYVPCEYLYFFNWMFF